MKAKFGALVVAGSGKINGWVASRNRAGAYFRTKVTPVNPQTSFQQGARNRLTGLSQDWRTLTEAQRTAWNSAVQDFARTDIFGDLRNPSGFNLYQRLNNNILVVGGVQLLVPPQLGEIASMLTLSAAAAAGAGTFTVTFTPAIPIGQTFKVFATPPVSTGVKFVKSEYRLIDVLTSADLSPATIAAAYTSRFGALVAGQHIFVSLTGVNFVTGQEGVPLQAEVIVAA